MNARTKLSAKGQVVIPKELRDRLAWEPGTALDVVETADGLVLRRALKKSDLSFDEAVARLRATVKWDGPIYRDADWTESIDQMMRERTDI
jgi:AbrB family looped-hinge helix DNA binding protein